MSNNNSENLENGVPEKLLGDLAEALEVPPRTAEQLLGEIAANLEDIAGVEKKINQLSQEHDELNTEIGQKLLKQQIERHETEWGEIGTKSNDLIGKIKSLGRKGSLVPNQILKFLNIPGVAISSAISLIISSPAEAAQKVLTYANCIRGDGMFGSDTGCAILGQESYIKAFGHLPDRGSGLYSLTEQGLFYFQKFDSYKITNLGQMDNLGVMHTIGDQTLPHPPEEASALYNPVSKIFETFSRIPTSTLTSVGMSILTIAALAVIVNEVTKLYYSRQKYPWDK